MKEILQHLYCKNDRRKLYAVSEQPGLVEWINQNCNQQLITENPPTKNLLHIKIQTILNPLQSLKCEYNNWLQYNVTHDKFYCVRTCPCWLDTANQRYRDTMTRKYGVPYSFQSPEIKEKIKNTHLERYGVSYTAQIPSVKEKKELLSMKNYGVSCPLQADEVKNQIKNTLLDRYGVTTVAHIDGVQAKKEQTCLNKYGEGVLARIPGVQETRKQTCMNKFGAPNMLSTPCFQQITLPTRRNNSLHKHGTDHPRKLVMSEYARSVLESAELLTDMITQFGFSGTIEKLQVANSTVYNYHRKHGLNLLSPHTSSAEREISDWLADMGISHIRNDRTICAPKELDIYIPDHNLAIEFNGLYWHSEEEGKYKTYHQEKTNQCAEQGIQLIHIFEDEWIKNKSVCQSIIKGRLGKIDNKIPARKCTVVEINNITLKPFLAANHLQGHSHGTINLALYHENDIVAVMTFGRPRYNKQVQWELIRLASKLDTHVIGGIKKLWSYFIKNYSPSSIVSYCDRRWFVGGVYSSLDFIKANEAAPTYWYTDCEHRYHRSRFTKKKAVKAALLVEGALAEEQLNNMTEKRITADILGLLRIWDCGQDTWTWKK